jgi:hypothetical protein
MTHGELTSEFRGIQMKMNETGLYDELAEKIKALYISLARAQERISNFIVLGSGSFTDTLDVTIRRRRMELVATIFYMRRLFRSKIVVHTYPITSSRTPDAEISDANISASMKRYFGTS